MRAQLLLGVGLITVLASAGLLVIAIRSPVAVAVAPETASHSTAPAVRGAPKLPDEVTPAAATRARSATFRRGSKAARRALRDDVTAAIGAFRSELAACRGLTSRVPAVVLALTAREQRLEITDVLPLVEDSPVVGCAREVLRGRLLEVPPQLLAQRSRMSVRLD